MPVLSTYLATLGLSASLGFGNLRAETEPRASLTLLDPTREPVDRAADVQLPTPVWSRVVPLLVIDEQGALSFLEFKSQWCLLGLSRQHCRLLVGNRSPLLRVEEVPHGYTFIVRQARLFVIVEVPRSALNVASLQLRLHDAGV